MSNDERKFEDKPHQRLITVNLLVSASRFEGGIGMDIIALENLCHFIDVFCLYDQAIVLGHGNALFPSRRTGHDFFEALKETNFLSLIQRSPQQVDAIFRIASTHIATVLGITDPDEFFPLFRLAWDAVEYDVSYIPDQVSEKWETQLFMEQRALSRVHHFIARTFLYLASADQLYLALTPDIERTPILTQFANQQEQFRGKILQVLTQRYQNALEITGYPELQASISPCAAIIFERARGKKSNIPYEMIRLRQELTSTRESLSKLEQEIFSQRDLGKAQAASLKWKDMINELERSYLSPSFRNTSKGRKVKSLVSMTPLLKDIADSVDSSLSIGKIIQILVDLPLEKVVQFLDRKTIIDIYGSLQPPNLLQLRNLLVPLFGESVLQRLPYRPSDMPGDR